MNIVEANNVSIRYITGDFRSIGLKEYLLRRLQNNYHVTSFWADKDVSFALEKGDMLGVIGANGAGKSTLLKAVCGIMEPTRGSIRTEGTIAALLELSTGFDSNLTVRENTYLRGALMHYTRRFMDEKYDEIIRFAELEDFQDYRFRQLSSGMKARLAFAIGCMVDPDIIILDEVFAVGDGAFREKCAQKMDDILSNGTTGIVVSHSISQIRRLSNKILWLDHGESVVFGSDVQRICDAYELFLKTKKRPDAESRLSLAADGPGRAVGN